MHSCLKGLKQTKTWKRQELKNFGTYIHKHLIVPSTWTVFYFKFDTNTYFLFKPNVIYHKIKLTFTLTRRQVMNLEHNIVTHSNNHCCSGNTTIHSLCVAELHHCQLYKNNECYTTLLCKVYAISNNKTYVSLHVKPVCLVMAFFRCTIWLNRS